MGTGHRKENQAPPSERQEELLGVVILIVVVGFHKHMHMSKQKIVHFHRVPFMVCHLHLNKAVVFKRNSRGLTLLLLENRLDCVFLNTQPLLPNP